MERKLLCIIVAFLSFSFEGNAFTVDQRVGQPWPMPQMYQSSQEAQSLSTMFTFNVVGMRCDILNEALDRYRNLIFGFSPPIDQILRFNDITSLMMLDVDVSNMCEDYPSLGMDESCKYVKVSFCLCQKKLSGMVAVYSSLTLCGVSTKAILPPPTVYLRECASTGFGDRNFISGLAQK